MFKPVLISSVVMLAGLAAFAHAADPVTEAMEKAYVPYRVALFKTNSDAQEESRQALLQTQQGWNRLTERFGAKPPVPYENDADFAHSLAEVSKVYVKALDEVGKNKLKEAHETLEHARDVMAEMRRRNQVIVFSDHMNAYHAEMEKVLDDGEKILGQPDGLHALTARVGVLEYLALKLKSEAPADYLKSEEFNGMRKAVEESVAGLKASLLAGNVDKVKEAIGKIKKPYSRMFIKFG